MNKRFTALLVFTLSLGSLLLFVSLLRHPALPRSGLSRGAQHSVLASRAMVVETQPGFEDALLFRLSTGKISPAQARGIARRMN